MSVIAKTETFQRGMARTRGEVGKFDKSVKRSQVTMTGLSRSFLRLAGIGGGLYMLTRGIRGAISAGLEQEKVERQLMAAIGGNISAMKKYAAEMQAQTIYGDELILSQMAYGKNLGITTEQLEAATTAAIGLAAKYRLELNSAMMLVGRAALGQTQMLTRYGIVLDETLGPQEKFNALLKIGADNFHLAQAETKSTAGAMAQFRNNVGDLGEEISMGVLPALTDMLTSINENKDAWIDFFKVLISGWTEVLSGFKEVRATINEFAPVYNKMVSERNRVRVGPGGFGGFGAGTMGAPPTTRQTGGEDLPIGKLDISPRGYQRISEMNNRVLEMEREAAKEGAKIEREAVKMTAEALKAENDMVKEYLASVRSMHDKTRMEKIRMLEDYKVAHFGSTKEIEAAEKRLNDEIISLQKSRVNAMEVYNAELREDMQNTSLYISEKFTDAAKSVEGSMSSAFQSMISEGASWKDAQRQFFADVGNAYAKMLSDMAARALMAGMTNMIVSGLFGGGGTTGAGSPAGGSTRMHSGWVPDGVPRFRSGRGLGPNEMAAIVDKDELLVPSDKVVKSNSGGGGIIFQPKIIIVRDEREAQIEAMNSDAGEKVIIQKVMSYKELLS